MTSVLKRFVMKDVVKRTTPLLSPIYSRLRTFLRLVALAVLIVFPAEILFSSSAMAAPLTCSSVYSTAINSKQVYSINTSTATLTPAATLPLSALIGVAALPGATPTLYSDNNTNPIHLQSTNGTLTGSNTAATFGSTYGGGLGADTSGRLFYIANNGAGVQHLWRFNTTTSAAVDVGAITSAIAGDTAWANLSPGDMMTDANGRLYYFGVDASAPTQNYLYYVDASMVAHRLGVYTSANAGVGVAFDPSGVIYTINTNLLYKIDLSAGFTSTLIGNTGNSSLIDLASCALPTMNPNVAATKTVRDVTTSQNPATLVGTNDILEYSVTITNSGNLPSDSSKFIDAIPAGTIYVVGSTQRCNSTGVTCVAAADVSGAAPFLGTGMFVNTSGQGTGVVLAGAANAAVVKFQVKVTSTGTPSNIVNTGQATYPTVSNGLPTTNTVNTTSTSVQVVTPVSIAGTVFEDVNGDGILNNSDAGTDTLTNGTSTNLYAVLTDNSNTVLQVVPVTDATGAYSFSNVLPSTDVKVLLSTTQPSAGTTFTDSTLTTGWVSTLPTTSVQSFNTGTTNIISKNFGIEQLPNTTDLNPASQTNPGGTTTVQVPTLAGTDPEDGALGTGKSFKIVTLPTNGTLYYNSIAVTVGQIITNYDPTKLTIDPNDGAITVSFTYAAIDAAGQQDPTPATISMSFTALAVPPSISPLLCPVTSYLIQKSPSQISIYNLATGQFGSFTTITGVDSNAILNAVGFNPLDGYMYALEDSAGANKDLYRLDQSGNAVKIGNIANLDFNANNAGDVDANGYYYVSNTSRNQVEIIDVNPSRTATYGTRVGKVTLPSSATSGPDLAINPVDGRLYTIRFDTKELWSFKIDVATQTVSSFTNHGKTTNAAGGAIISITAGAVYFDSNGNFYAFDNTTGNLWKFPTNPTVSTAGQLIGNGGTAPLNDGARCALAPVPSLGLDYGDAPDTSSSTGIGNYQTLAVNNGPYHAISNGLRLGNSVTADNDGFGNGVDTNGNATNDIGDDGVQLSGSSFQGQSLTPGSSMTLNLATQGSGVLNAWIDWNRNGNFEDAGEKIATNVSPTANAIALNMTVPSGASAGTTYARFRFSSDANLTSTGYASDGEVEDYQVAIAAATPSLSGNIFNDLDGSKIKAASGENYTAANITVVLLDASNKVVSTAAVNATGDHTLNNIPAGTYSVKIIQTPATALTTGVVIPPANDILPTNWVATGENNNGTPDAIVDRTQTVTVASANIANINFGIEQLPDTTALTPASQTNPGGAATVQVPTLEGTDPEDGALGSGKSFKIVTLPTNGTLYYNSIAVIAGQIITSYAPTKLTIDPNDGAITVSFTYAAIDAAGKEDSTPATVTIPFTAATADLTITKSHTGNFTQGQTGATYTLTATNSGTAATSGTVTVVDTLPAGLTATAISGTGWTCTLATLTCTRSDVLAASASYPVITLTVDVASNAASSLTNSASISGGGETNITNNSATDPTTVTALADLRLSKTSTPASPSVGGSFTYTITVTNDGPSTATNVQVTDRLPAITEVLVNSPLITASQGSTIYSATTPSVVWTVGTLAPNASATLTIPATRLTPNYNLNVVEVTASDQPDPDSTPNNKVSGEDDQASVTVPEQLVDIAVTKTVDNSTPTVGQTVVFTVSVTNTSSTFTATGVGLKDVLPAGLTYQSNTPNQGVYTPRTGVWSVGSINPGATATLTITATVNISGSITNTAQLSALDQSDSNSANNSGSAVLTASASSNPKLILVKRITAINTSPITTVVDPTTTPDPNDESPNWPVAYLKGSVDTGIVKPGDELEYTIYFLSSGDTPITKVSICDLVPANSTFLPTTYSGLAPTDGGLPGADSGISLTIGPSSFYLSNAKDTDRGEFFLADTTPSGTCSGANDNGAVVVNIVTGANALPNATAPGTPSDSYGYIRFRALVK